MSTKINKSSYLPERDYALDLLRIVCMLMIQILHMCTHGKADILFDYGTFNWQIIKFLYFASICSVNLFVLISGYFLVNKPFNFKRVFLTGSSVWFYSWIIFIISIATKIGKITIDTVLTAVFPIAYRQYWFATCYIVLCIIAPFINRLLIGLSQKEFQGLLICLFLMNSLWHDFLPLSNPVGVDNGYSVIWFVFLYCLAGYIRLHCNGIQVKRAKCLVIYTAITLLMVLIFFCISYLERYFSVIKEYAFADYFSRYCSVLTVAQTLALFFAFKGIVINRDACKKAISFFAPLTFGVYLIHDNANFREFLYMDVLKINQLPNSLFSVAAILSIVLLCFAVFALVEYGRKKCFNHIFRMRSVDLFCKKIQEVLDTKIYYSK